MGLSVACLVNSVTLYIAYQSSEFTEAINDIAQSDKVLPGRCQPRLFMGQITGQPSCPPPCSA